MWTICITLEYLPQLPSIYDKLNVSDGTDEPRLRQRTSLRQKNQSPGQCPASLIEWIPYDSQRDDLQSLETLFRTQLSKVTLLYHFQERQ